MPKNLNKKFYRIIDANLNRLREGLRVCEDVSRFILNDKLSCQRFKKIRHQIFNLIKKSDLEINQLIYARDSRFDVGRRSLKAETKRRNTQEIFQANIQRTKESLRVLEEFYKLINKNTSRRFKSIRYAIYTLEKKIIERLSTSSNLR